MKYEEIIYNLSLALAKDGITEDVIINSDQLFDRLYLEQVTSPLRSYPTESNMALPLQMEYRFHHGRTIVRPVTKHIEYKPVVFVEDSKWDNTSPEHDRLKFYGPKATPSR